MQICALVIVIKILFSLTTYRRLLIKREYSSTIKYRLQYRTQFILFYNKMWKPLIFNGFHVYDNIKYNQTIFKNLIGNQLEFL